MSALFGPGATQWFRGAVRTGTGGVPGVASRPVGEEKQVCGFSLYLGS